jgi:hypothetical protein
MTEKEMETASRNCLMTKLCDACTDLASKYSEIVTHTLGNFGVNSVNCNGQENLYSNERTKRLFNLKWKGLMGGSNKVKSRFHSLDWGKHCSASEDFTSVAMVKRFAASVVTISMCLLMEAFVSSQSLSSVASRVRDC